MKKSIILVFAILYGVVLMGQPNSPCPGLKNPSSFTAGASAGTFVGFYSGQTGSKPSSSCEPNALTGQTGINLTSDIIPASQMASVTDGGGSSYCGASLSPSNHYRIMSNTDGPGTGTQIGKDPLVSYQLPYCPT